MMHKLKPSFLSNVPHCEKTRPRGYKTFFMLNSTEQEIYPARCRTPKCENVIRPGKCENF